MIALYKYDLCWWGLWCSVHSLHFFAFQTRASIPTVLLPHLPCSLDPYSGQKKGPRFHKVSCLLLSRIMAILLGHLFTISRTYSRIHRQPISIPGTAAREVVNQNIYSRDLSAVPGESIRKEIRRPPLPKQLTKSYSLLYAVDIIAEKENKGVQLCFWLSYLLCPWKDYDNLELEEHRAIYVTWGVHSRYPNTESEPSWEFPHWYEIRFTTLDPYSVSWLFCLRVYSGSKPAKVKGSLWGQLRQGISKCLENYASQQKGRDY